MIAFISVDLPAPLRPISPMRRRFGLWTLMYMLGDAPDLDVAFKDEADREAARNFMDMVDRMG
ncbi:MAG: hypothetical protein LKM31_16620 [Sphingobium sp.]|jgi:hypothetical protein|nr:hypothetical protein [Sphingobium sp.]